MHILPNILRSKGNQEIKCSQLIEFWDICHFIVINTIWLTNEKTVKSFNKILANFVISM